MARSPARMRIAPIWLPAFTLLIAAPLIAQTTTTATLGITANVQGSLSVEIGSAHGILQSGMDSATASTNLQNVTKYGSLLYTTRTINTTDWSLSSQIGIIVHGSGTSTSHTLTAQLASAPQSA